MTRLFVIFTLTMALGVTPVATAPTGDEPTRVQVELFSDFQCPFCASLAPALRQLQTDGVEGVQLDVQLRQFPLSIHPRSQLAHQAALAAGQQGKFWEMHDLLFANQSRVDRNDLLRYAEELRLDAERFLRDLDSDVAKQQIANDLLDGQRRGVSGTPTLYVNGTAYSGTRTFAQLQALVRNEANRARALSRVPDTLLSKGPADAPVTVELFADLQSPVTRSTMSVIERLLAERPTRVRLQFRSLPLPFHERAPLAHEAAITAGAGGRFWEMVQYILDHQDSWREQDLAIEAMRVGLDGQAFAESLVRHELAERVRADLVEAARRGIRGSPVVVVAGTRIDGIPAIDRLLELVDATLQTVP